MDLAALRSLRTVDELASHLGYTYSGLSSLLYGSAAASNYRVFQIEKRAGGYRTIAAPRSELKCIQRQILEALSEAYQPTRSSYGFVRGRSIVHGAARHAGRRIVVNVDLADFFPSITFWRVRGLFLSAAFNLPYKVATVLSHICCRATQLPQGAPTSPVISNFICSAMDRELGAFVGARGGRYSRYCDDMTMSFESALVASKEIASKGGSGVILNPAVVSIIQRHGFMVNPSKLKIRRAHERQEVTGLVVNEKVNVKRELVRLLHTQLHCIEKFGLSAAAAKNYELLKKSPDGNMGMYFAAAIRGRTLFVKMVRHDGDAVFANLAKRFNKANIYPKKLRYYRRVQSSADLKSALWVIEVGYDDPAWGYLDSQGTGFLLDGVGLVTCAHVVINPKSNRPFREIEIFRVGSIRRYKAHVASFDPHIDLAVLYIEEIDYTGDCDTRFKISPHSDLVGRSVIMAGFPSYREGQSHFTANTEISAANGNHLEISGQVIGGISGGPLLDMDYRVVGVLVRGVLGGGAKNEAVRATKAFHLCFKSQNLALLEPERFPISPLPQPRWRRILSRTRSILLGITRRMN